MKLNVFYQMKQTSLDCYIEIHAGAGRYRKPRLGRNVKKNVFEMGRSKKF